MLYKSNEYIGIPYPNPTQELLDFSAYTSKQLEYDFSSALFEAEKSINEIANKKVYNLFANIASVLLSEKEGLFQFYPMCSSSSDRSFMPEDLTDNDVNFLNQSVDQIKPLEFQAKTADVLWEKTHRNEYAEKALNAYIELVRKNSQWNEQDEIWGRLVFIDSSTKNKKLDIIKNIAKNKIQNSNLGISATLWFVLHVFRTEDLKIDSELYHSIIGQMKAFANIARLYIPQNFYNALKEIQKISEEDSDTVAHTLIHSLVSHATALGNDLLAADLYDIAIEYLLLIKDRCKYDVENNKILFAQRRQNIRRNQAPSLSPSSVEIGDKERSVKTYKNFRDIDNKRFALCAMVHLADFTQGDFDKLKLNVKCYIQDSLYIQHCRFIAIDQNGIVSSRHSGINTEKNLQEQDVFKYNLASYYVNFLIGETVVNDIIPALQAILEKFDYPEDELVSILEQKTSIPSKLLYAFAHGTTLALQQDFFAAIHILVPAFEAYMRDICINNHWAISCFQKVKDGMTEDEPLSLKNLINNTYFAEKYGESVKFQIESIFCDKAGGSLRNKIAHGEFFLNEKNLRTAIFAITFILNFVMKKTK